MSLSAFILPVCLILCAVGGCKSVSTEPIKPANTADASTASGVFPAGGGAGGSAKPGITVNPADLPNTQSKNTTEPQCVPNPYTDDVIKLRQKMHNLDHREPLYCRDKKGGDINNEWLS